MKKIILFILVVIIFLSAYFFIYKNKAGGYINTGRFADFKTNISKTSIDFDDLIDAGTGKDGIPALTKPDFVNIKDSNIKDEVVGLLIMHKGEKKFYPYNILVWHEVVNDSIDDLNFAVTFCPLCGSAIVFDRNVDGKVLEFGVSGFLYDSNLVMYDDKTESLWSQAGLKALVGDYLGKELEALDMKLIPMSELKEKYPDAKVLSEKTGYSRDYDFYPYGKYDYSEEILYPISVSNKKFPAKEVMYVVSYKGKSIAFPYAYLEKGDSKFLEVEGDNLEIRRDSEGVGVLLDDKILPGYYEMWFSWATNHQDNGIVWEVE